MRSKQKTKEIKDIVRQRIRHERREAGLTQEELCERAGISIDAVSRIEGGSRIPTLETLEKIALALDLAVADLVQTGQKRPPRKHSATIQRIITMLERESPAMQQALKDVLKALLKALHNVQGTQEQPSKPRKKRRQA